MINKYNLKFINILFYIITILVPIYYGTIAVTYAISNPYIIQDDARIHIVWLEKIINPQLFPNDIFSNYFPDTYGTLGFKTTYKILSDLGIHPLIAAKVIPVFLGIITSIYYYKFCQLVISNRLGSFVSALILNQNIWLNDDITSATPRAFLFPIFAGFLFYLTKEKMVPCMLMILLQGLFYPSLVLVQIGILLIRLIKIENFKIKFSNDNSNFKWAILGLSVALIALLPELLRKSIYGDLITFTQMQKMLDFYPNGRSKFFSNNLFQFFWNGTSGLCLPEYPFSIWLFILFPFFKNKYINIRDFSKIHIIFQALFVSLMLYLLAHIFMFKLYWPNRYSYHTFPFILSLLAGYVVAISIHKFQELAKKVRSKNLLIPDLKILFLTSFMTILFFYSTIYSLNSSVFLGKEGWIIGKNQKIYEFLSKKPMNTLVGSLSDEASNIPAFTLRSVLVAKELAVPYHMGFYGEFSDRIRKILMAQYATDLNPMKKLIETYNINYWLLDKDAFSRDYFSKKVNIWLNQYPPESIKAVQQMQKKQLPALSKVVDLCTVVNDQEVVLLNSSCILEQSNFL